MYLGRSSKEYLCENLQLGRRDVQIAAGLLPSEDLGMIFYLYHGSFYVPRTLRIMMKISSGWMFCMTVPPESL
jgi:hypothetical protein